MGKTQYNEERIKERINKIVLEAITEVLSKDIVTETRITVDSDKLMEYLWLRPSDTGLNVDVFVDDGGSYRRDGHRLILIARNGYSESVDEFLYFSIERFPKILNREISINISHNDVYGIARFIQNNLKTLQGLADDKISQRDFVDSLRKITEPLTEGKEVIEEMSRLRSSETHLPMDIWLDEGGTYRGHAPRIKFKSSNEQQSSREYSTMTLTNPPEIKNLPPKTNLTTKDLRKLENFVVKNMDLLLKLCNKEIDYLHGFLPNMVIEK